MLGLEGTPGGAIASRREDVENVVHRSDLREFSCPPSPVREWSGK
jgi:hypothetical protein